MRVLGGEQGLAPHGPVLVPGKSGFLGGVLVGVQRQHPRLGQQRPHEAEQQQQSEVRAQGESQGSKMKLLAAFSERRRESRYRKAKVGRGARYYRYFAQLCCKSSLA